MNSMTNCPRCGKLFTQLRSPICSVCERDEEESFKTVKEYIQENPFSTMGDIVAATGVSAKRIQRFLREGRLEVSKGMEGVLKCDGCGLPIMKGRYCPTCTVEISQKIDETFKRTPVINNERSSGAKMHYQGRK